MRRTLFMFFLFAEIVNVSAQPLTGKCGKNTTWLLHHDGTLIISGTGETFDFGKKPQNATFVKVGIAEKIRTLDLSHFIGEVKDNLFWGCVNLNTIILSEKQQCGFSSNAFNGCLKITTLELMPEALVDKNKRCRIAFDTSLMKIPDSNIPVNTIRTVVLNQKPELWFKTIKPFAPIETYDHLRSSGGIIGQWQNGGWNGVVQRTSSYGEGYYHYEHREIAIEVNGKRYEVNDKSYRSYPIKKIEYHTDEGPTNTDFWDIEERLGKEEVQHDYYNIIDNSSERLYCKILEYKNEKWNGLAFKYMCIFPNNDYFIADNPVYDPDYTAHANFSYEKVPFKGFFQSSNGGFYYGDFTSIMFVDVRDYGLLYPFFTYDDATHSIPVKDGSDFLNRRTGKGVFYDKNKNELIYGLWGKGQYKGSPEKITIEDIIDCPEPLPLDFVTTCYVEKEVAEWLKKDEFETTQEWKVRTSESNRQKRQECFAKEIQIIYLKKISGKIHLNLQLSAYDADNKCFPVVDNTFGTMNVVLDNITPQEFKSSWDKMVTVPTIFINKNKIDILEIDFLLYDEQIKDYSKVAHYRNPEKKN